MASEKKPGCVPIVRNWQESVPLDELERRLEAQRVPVADAAAVCYTDICPEDCFSYCPSGFSGCTDLCGCDGTMCAAECSTLCVADSCVVDII